jgi:hypothetical protein
MKAEECDVAGAGELGSFGQLGTAAGSFGRGWSWPWVRSVKIGFALGSFGRRWAGLGSFCHGMHADRWQGREIMRILGSFGQSGFVLGSFRQD